MRLEFGEPYKKPPTKPISNFSLHEMGLTKDDFVMVKETEDLKKNPPLIVIAEAVKSVAFVQNYYKAQVIKKHVKYVMGISTFQQLQYDPVKKVKILKPSSMKFTNLYNPYNGEDLSNKTLLVWRSGGIGDLLFIQPNLIYLKEKYPTCKILFSCGPQYQPMVETWDCIDKVLDLPFPIRYLISSDYHVLFEGVIERTKEAEQICSYNLFSRWMGLDLPNEKLCPSQKPKDEEVEKCRKILKDFNVEENKFVVMQLNASSPIRTPKEEVFAKICKFIVEKGYKILITDNPRRSSEISKFVNKVDKENLFNFSKFSESIATTIALTSISKMVISPDSSLIHIAESLGIKSFGIYGPFPGKVRLETYKNVEWVDCKKECSPCFKHGQKPCSNSTLGFSNCFNNINYDEVFEKIERQLM